MSRQKELVFKVLSTSEGHLTASEVYERARKEIPNISLGTVYRDLNELFDEKRIGRFTPAGASAIFDKTPQAHGHLVCAECGNVSDIHDPNLEENLMHLTSGRLISADLTVEYVCEKCSSADRTVNTAQA